MQVRETKRLEKLEALQEQVPNASRKEIKLLLELEQKKKHKPKPAGKHVKNGGKE